MSAATTAPTEFDTSGWPTSAEIAADERERRAAQAEWDTLVAALQVTSTAANEQRQERAALRAAAVEAAAPITGPLPVIVPLTKADAYRGMFQAVVTEVCDRLDEIRRTRRTSELADVVTLLQAVI